MEVLNMVLSIWVTAHLAMTICSPVCPVPVYDVGQEEQNTSIFKKGNWWWSMMYFSYLVVSLANPHPSLPTRFKLMMTLSEPKIN